MAIIQYPAFKNTPQPLGIHPGSGCNSGCTDWGKVWGKGLFIVSSGKKPAQFCQDPLQAKGGDGRRRSLEPSSSAQELCHCVTLCLAQRQGYEITPPPYLNTAEDQLWLRVQQLRSPWRNTETQLRTPALPCPLCWSRSDTEIPSLPINDALVPGISC